MLPNHKGEAKNDEWIGSVCLNKVIQHIFLEPHLLIQCKNHASGRKLQPHDRCASCGKVSPILDHRLRIDHQHRQPAASDKGPQQSEQHLLLQNSRFPIQINPRLFLTACSRRHHHLENIVIRDALHLQFFECANGKKWYVLQRFDPCRIIADSIQIPLVRNTAIPMPFGQFPHSRE